MMTTNQPKQPATSHFQMQLQKRNDNLLPKLHLGGRNTQMQQH